MIIISFIICDIVGYFLNIVVVAVIIAVLCFTRAYEVQQIT